MKLLHYKRYPTYTEIYLRGELIEVVSYPLSNYEDIIEAILGKEIIFKGVPMKIVRHNPYSIVIQSINRTLRIEEKNKRKLIEIIYGSGIWCDSKYVKIVKYNLFNIIYEIDGMQYSLTYEDFYQKWCGGIFCLIDNNAKLPRQRKLIKKIDRLKKYDGRRERVVESSSNKPYIHSIPCSYEKDIIYAISDYYGHKVESYITDSGVFVSNFHTTY